MDKECRIVFIGGASMTWMPSFAHDILACEALAGSTIALMDIDGDHLRTMRKYIGRMVRDTGKDLRVESTTERAEALAGADYVVTTFGPGGHEYWREDVAIALRYGIQEPAGMSVGPGGLMQGLKGIPTIVEIAQDMEKLCPDARLFNYTNPMSSLTLAFNQYSTIQGVGVCPGIYMYMEKIGRVLNIPPDELHFIAGGVNHMNWLIELRHGDKHVLPEYRDRVRDAGLEPISRTLYDLFGAWPVPNDTHTAEFVPFFIGKGRDIEKRYNLTHDYIERRIEKRELLWQDIEAAAMGERPLIQGGYESHERLEPMIQSIEFNEQHVIYLNVINNGAISNVLPGACVEVPVVVDRYGFHPVVIGALPPGAAAITNLAAAVQDLTVEAALKGNRHLALQALALDPLTYTLDVDETGRMLDEMLEASRPVLPRFFD